MGAGKQHFTDFRRLQECRKNFVGIEYDFLQHKSSGYTFEHFICITLPPLALHIIHPSAQFLVRHGLGLSCFYTQGFT